MPNWQVKFDEEMLKQAAQQIQVDWTTIKYIGGFENVVYSFPKDDHEFILRVTHQSHQDLEMVISELDFMDHLAKHGVQLAPPIPFQDGSLVQTLVKDEEKFMICVMKKAPGGHVNASDPYWGTELFEQWGEVTGRMHALTLQYERPETVLARPHQGKLEFDFANFGTVEQQLFEKLLQINDRINQLPRNREVYGLCHRDLHSGNFFVNEGQITVFDFDDCGYDYMVHDIAIAVYYSTIFGDRRKPEVEQSRTSSLAAAMLRSFMKGYNREYALDNKWLEELPLFIEKRRLELVLLLFQDFSESQVEENRVWLARNIHDALNDKPCLVL